MGHPRYRGAVIDVHCHASHAYRESASSTLATAGIARCLNLWNLEWPPPSFARWSSELADCAGIMALGHAPNLEGIGEAHFADRLEASVREAARAGAAAIKVWKNLGLTLRDCDNKLVAVDDARLEALWRTSGEEGLPVVIHVADPVAFFAPLDEHNERLGELQEHPDWWFGGAGMPSFRELIRQLDKLIGDYPETTFAGAHMGCFAEDLDAVGEMLDRHPNYVIDTSARIGEMGRKDPGKVHDFFVRYADRILFGSDFSRTDALMQPEDSDPRSEQRFFDTHWRYFESDTEHLPHPLPIQGAWTVSGIDLPDSVLQALYYDNAARLLPRLRP